MMPRIVPHLSLLRWALWSAFIPLLVSGDAHFSFPTSNHALLEENGDDAFFVGTPGKPWTSGSFGCVRSSGYQFHEGADIRAVQRDRRNEPIDPVLCTANGWIVHTSRKSGLSNYGKYVVIGHKIEGLEIFSLYAHLSSILPEWKPGKWILSGQQIGVMGRTSNTKQRISRDRAHLHFELALIVNHDFPAYFKKRYPKGINDHGMWNGQNLAGMDPAEIFRAQAESTESFSLRTYLREKTPMFTIQVNKLNFPWANRYLPLILRATDVPNDQITGYEISFDSSGLPFQLKPILLQEDAKKEPYELLSVNEEVYKANRCRKLIVKTGTKWRFTATGKQAMNLLFFTKK
ncbi:MAG: M23 family metallopeptidase [Verrucomicrobia bacterium]|jgi:peptidoglycan LD-endopeptidase LytH|nr:M23 family metallopeptidase [Verrucomicrobiota bacterium]MDA7644835.1 M23 family metallopeptidase [bacterium]MDB4796799.1 M23 family metallopeptidase [bacterium]